MSGRGRTEGRRHAGTSQRQRGTSPRAVGDNPRALGVNPQAFKAESYQARTERLSRAAERQRQAERERLRSAGVVCVRCGDGSWPACPRCHGRGAELVNVECPSCDGTGWEPAPGRAVRACRQCDGFRVNGPP